MRITFLGSGSAFCMDNWQSNMLLEMEPCDGYPDGVKMLFDCGGDIRWSLADHGLKATDIDAVYISHLHADHIGGLEYLAFVSYFAKTVRGGRKPKLIGNSQLLKELWMSSLRGGLDSIQMIDADMSTYFDILPIANSGTFNVGLNVFKTVQTIHVIADTSFVKSFGLIATLPAGESQKKVFITSDTQYAPSQLNDFIRSSDVVFHDCETAKFASGVHAHYNDLKDLPADLKGKMWLYHYNNVAELPDAKADGFLGFVQKGQAFEF
jgi:ribonuclease BN (tRNA processing enzyme)